MKLIFLGSGSAFTPREENYHSNMILENDAGKRLMIDCGSDARFSLYENGLCYTDIRDIYISHLHADHAGGLEWIAFSTKFDPNYQGKPNLHISEEIVDDLWEHTLSGGLRSLQAEVASLSTYFNVVPISKNSGFVWEGLELQTVQTVHIMNGFSIMPSFGLLFKANGKTIYITTDTQFTPYQSANFYNMADIIFHDCETTEIKSGVHPHYADLVTLDPKIKKKIWLYHYNPGKLPDAKADGFCGFVEKGQCFDFSKM